MLKAVLLLFFLMLIKNIFAKKAQLSHLCPVTCFETMVETLHLSVRAAQRRKLHCIS